MFRAQPFGCCQAHPHSFISSLTSSSPGQNYDPTHYYDCKGSAYVPTYRYDLKAMQHGIQHGMQHATCDHNYNLEQIVCRNEPCMLGR